VAVGAGREAASSFCLFVPYLQFVEIRPFCQYLGARVLGKAGHIKRGEMRLQGRVRRYAVAAAVGSALVIGVALGFAGAANAAAPPGRFRIHLIKLCPPKATNPAFHVINWTNHPDPFDKQLVPTTITFSITKGDKPAAPAIPFVVKGESGSPIHTTYALAPGQEIYVTLQGVTWPGPHFAQFMASPRGNAPVLMTSKQYCACEQPQPTTSTAPTSTTTTTNQTTFTF